jgi:hypothetical protein
MLNSNSVFSPDQTLQFSKTIANIKADMSKMDDEMARMQMAMDQLATER